MKLLKTAILAGVAAITLATGAQAAGDVYERRTWAEPGRGWVIEYTPEINTCWLGREHDNGVLLQLVYFPRSRSFSLRLLNEKWTKIENNAVYKLKLHMDGGADRWVGDAKGLWTNDGIPGFSLNGLSYEFIESFMKRHRVDVYSAASGNWVTALALDGTSAAMVSMLQCLEAHKSGDGIGTPAPAKPKPQVREFQS